MHPGIAKTQRITQLQLMQLTTTTISHYKTAENSMRESYVQTMKNMLYLLDLYGKKMIHIPDLIEGQIHSWLFVVNRHQISIPLLEMRKIEITQKKHCF